MNSRERVLATIRHEEPDRVPIDIEGKLLAKTNSRLIKFWSGTRES